MVPDSVRQFASLGSGPGPAIPAMARDHRRLARSQTQQTCPTDPSQPLVEPEARQVMNVDAANQLADGHGIRVGIIADGIDPNLPDLIRRDGSHVLFDYRDFSGFGPGAPTDGREAGHIWFTPPAVTSSGIPNSPTKVLRAGHPVKATITVTNTGNSAKDFFVDPRLVGKVLQTLAGLDVSNVTLPLPMNGQPSWLVPTRTTLLDVVARGTVPVTMDVSWLFGDPDVLGKSTADRSAASLSAPEIAPGFFFASPQATGPFTSGTTGTVNLTAVARTNRFDSAVTSTTGDVWALGVKAGAPYSPLTINPGRKGTITLTIKPNAPKGTVIHGFISVDTLDLATASGDEVVDIPYSYKVG